ncbi:hypothetical protein [Nocardioides sp.]|uniref:hypothetical protein n=1 Tax=Nocardioides sp. TaxID=35761 RepID=UPI002622B8A3|nr:hypothetical protein [Nocardioides sp.]
MSPADLVDLDHHVHSLRTSAEHCRTEAHALRARVAASTWSGATAEAFERAAAGHVRMLLLGARQLEAAAIALEQHSVSCAATLTAAQQVASVAGDVVSGIGHLAHALVP